MRHRNKNTNRLEDLKAMIDKLRPKEQEDVRKMVENILKKHRRSPKRKLRLDWAGGLEEFRDQFTALSLQKKSLEWRID